MKIYVLSDMEGASGIVKAAQVGADPGLYATARKFLTWDVNACVRGCIAGGATRVVVADTHGHNGGFNFLWEELDSRAEYIQGSLGATWMSEIAGFDGLILLAQHAMAGTPAAILEHTCSSKAYQNLRMNGRLTGEMGIVAGIAGDYGVPPILATGDDKVCREAKAFFPGIVTAQVKTGFACEGGSLLPKEKAHALIEQKAAEAVRACAAGKFKPFRVKRPVRLRLELVSRGNIPARGNKPWLKVIDGRTYEVSGNSVAEAAGRLY